MPQVNLPIPTPGLSDKDTIQNLIDVVYKMRKELDFLLQNLDEKNVIKAQEAVQYFGNLSANQITTGTLDADKINVINLDATTIVTNNLITETLYADKGIIAELTVDRFDTSSKVQNYLTSNTSDVNYIRMQDQYMEFVTASTDGLSNVQLTDRNSAPVYWIDGTHAGITLDVTAFPVMIYVYTEAVKLKVAFDNIGGVYTPQMTWGIGNGDGDNEKGYLIKGVSGFDMKYITNDVEQILRNSPNGIQVSGVGTKKKSIRNISFDSVSPESPEIYDIWINTTDNSWSFWNGIEWDEIVGGWVGSPFPPGIYGTVGEPLVIQEQLSSSNLTMLNYITDSATVNLLTDITATDTEAVNAIALGANISDSATVTIT